MPQPAAQSSSKEDTSLPYDERDEDYLEFEEYEESQKPKAAPFYKRKKYWIFCAVLTVITVAIAIPIGLLVIFPKIAQLILNQSTMAFESIQITNPSNKSLDMNMNGKLGNTGPFAATIQFPDPINVYYNNVLLGSMRLPETKASGGGGDLVASATFSIDDENAFGSFSADMMNQDSFTWVLKSKVTIVALGRTVNNLELDKPLKLSGMGGFPGVKILRFDLPSDAPNGQGINLVIDTAMNNKSPIGVTLGTIVLDISCNDTYLGQVKATGASLMGNSESVLNLTGIMAPQTTPEGLATVSLKVPLQAPGALNIIKSISLGPMGMNWTNQDDYAPLANSPGVVAAFEMPFGFSLNVTQVQNKMTIVYNNKELANLNADQWGPATTSKDANGTAINFSLPPTPFVVGADAHADFDDFVTKLTIGSSQGFTVSGFAGTIAHTPIGQVQITGIPFKSDVALSGLQGLKTQPTVINSLTVIDGKPEGLQIALNLTMVNPSQLSIFTGNDARAAVTFAMQYAGDNVGTVIFDKLDLVPGENLRSAGAIFTPTGTPGGQELLQKYMSNQVASVDIFGSAQSSAIAPLAAGLQKIQLQSNMPGNPAQLLLSTALTILDDTGATGIAMATVTINNPFLPGLTIQSIKSTVQYNGRQLGVIDIPSVSIQVPGASQQASQPLPLTMDLSIDSLLSLMIDQAKINNLDSAPIVALGKMAKDPAVKIPSSVFAGFNLPNFVRAAMAGLKVDVSMSVNVMVGEYATSLTLTQNGVPTTTDDTIMKLLPIVGRPIAQSIVDLATLSFESVMINNPAETAFTTDINGLIANTGPFDAEITFPSGSSVSWLMDGNQTPIGQIAMPKVSAKADVGAVLKLTNVAFQVASASSMADFVGYSLKAESFEWSVSASNMTVIAMGAPIPGIQMTKSVKLKGFNGLQGLVIEKYDLPSNDPNGIHLVLTASLPNPSNVGIEMGTVEFTNIFQGQDMGFVKTSGLKLLPNALTPISMQGTLVKQTSEEGLKALGDMFRMALNGGTPNLMVQGKSVTPASGPVSWLSSAFGALTMNVTLPSIGKQDIITGITMKTMTLDFTGGDPYTIMTSSDNIEAGFKIPFAFPLSITQVAEDINIQLPQGSNVANLKIPTGPAQTISPGVLKTAYKDVPLKVFDEARDRFNAFSKTLTTGPGVQFFLSGTADTVADTAAGQVTISSVPVGVSSTLTGMNLNAGGATIANISVTGGTSEYLVINQNVILQNPSGLTVKVGDVGFDIGYSGQMMGRAVVSNMVLAPGTNTLPAVFHLQPSNAQTRDAFLSGFVAGASFNLDVAGSRESTTVESLKDAMASVKLSSTIQGINDKLIALGSASQPDILEMLQIFHPRQTPVQVMIYNPFDTPLYIKSMKASTVWNGHDFGLVDQEAGFTVPPKSTFLSPTLTMVSPAGLGFMSTLIPFMAAYPQLLVGATAEVPFNIKSTITAVVGGKDGYEGVVQYTQDNTVIKVQVNGKAPKSALPPALGGTFGTTPSASPQSETTVTSTATASATGSPSPSPADPTTQPTPSNGPPSAIVKRQISGFDIPEDLSPAGIEAWIKSTVNQIAQNNGQAAPYS
ncbi:hypothetical protein BGW38_008458 [Lunasporangiospora selenospora]|uniref:Uncharacterized protein n=1 Tax=Lunasporangiospora selenospora TaxID=979761 RepID=A0A9P6KGA4_9FUNG|nr:hypothetical protein BGW38_008458 [Lunasporangiospora selenospora]